MHLGVKIGFQMWPWSSLINLLASGPRIRSVGLGWQLWGKLDFFFSSSTCLGSKFPALSPYTFWPPRQRKLCQQCYAASRYVFGPHMCSSQVSWHHTHTPTCFSTSLFSSRGSIPAVTTGVCIAVSTASKLIGYDACVRDVFLFTKPWEGRCEDHPILPPMPKSDPTRIQDRCFGHVMTWMIAVWRDEVFD